MVDQSSLDGLRITRSDSERPSPFRRRALVAGIVILLIAAGAWAITRDRGLAVRVAPAKAISNSTGGGAAVLNASGYVTARRRATVSSKITGKVTEVYVEEGMQVREGDVLARLDAEQSSRGLALVRAQAVAAGSALEETRVRIREAQLDYERADRLTRSEISSRADLDRARAQLDAARARLAAQTDQYTSAQRQVDMQKQSVDESVIRAPFDGVVISKDAQPGEMISPVSAGGGFTRTGICTIVDMSSLEIEVDVNEAYINRVRKGQRVEAILDAYPEWKIKAHVITPVPTADRQKATVRVRIAFDEKDERILPDMGVKVGFITDETTAAARAPLVEIPKSALRRDGQQDVVFVLAGGKAERRAVKVHGTEGELVRLASGVQNGEQVIVEAPPELADGRPVTVEN